MAGEKILLSERLARSICKQYSDLEMDDGIDMLDIADGLKELLRINKLTLDSLVLFAPSELADILGIDCYVARIICESAKKKVSIDSNESVFTEATSKDKIIQ